jgi:hypothetical protein
VVEFPIGRLRGWLQLAVMGLPVLSIAIGLALINLREAAGLDARASAIEVAADHEAAVVRTLQGQLDAARKATTMRASYGALLDGTSSRFLLLNELKRGLPEDVTVSRVQVHDAVLSIEFRAANVLQVVAAMNRRRGWKAAAEGSITADAASGTEVATIDLEIAP